MFDLNILVTFFNSWHLLLVIEFANFDLVTCLLGRIETTFIGGIFIFYALHITFFVLSLHKFAGLLLCSLPLNYILEPNFTFCRFCLNMLAQIHYENHVSSYVKAAHSKPVFGSGFNHMQ